MRVGFITGEYPPMQGGVGAYTQILARHLHQQGHEMYIFTDRRASGDEFLIEASVTRWTPGALRAAQRWAAAHRLDVLSIQYQTAAYAMSPYIHFAPELLRPFPVVTTFHDLRFPYLFPKAGRVRPWIVRRLARRSAGVILTNDEDAAAFAQFGIETSIIPIGSNIPPDDSPALARADSDFLIAYFGLFNASKGVDLLIQALPLLRAQGIPARLMLIGAGAGSSDKTNIDYTKEIDHLIDHIGARGMVEQTGFVDDALAAAYLHTADVVALPFRDGASLRRGSLMAALACGAATLTTQPTIPIPALVDAAWFCSPTLAGVTDGLTLLHNDSALRARLRAGALTAARRFEWGQIAADTARAFQRAVERHP